MARSDKQSGGSWRGIQQKNKRGKATTKVARQRKLILLLRSAFLLLLLVAIATGVVAIKYFSSMAETVAVEPSPGKTEVDFTSDGVLSGKWFSTNFPDVARSDIRDIDVGSLKGELEKFGQVVQATVTVSLPSLLKIYVEEREPMLRIRFRDAQGQAETLLVARDGVIYSGSQYPQETLLRLPGVAGLRIRKSGSGFEPISGLEPVAHLLDLAKDRLPALYGHWRVIDLTDWNPDAEYRPSLIRVSSTHIEEITFSIYGLEEQVEQLGGILQHVDRYQLGQPKSIDLSFGEEAVIRYN